MKPISWKEAQKITMDALLAQEERRSEAEEWVTEPDALATLMEKLIYCHQPIKRKDEIAFREQYHVQCRACDNSVWRIWKPGDPEYSCDIWRECQKLGLAPVGTDG